MKTRKGFPFIEEIPTVETDGSLYVLTTDTELEFMRTGMDSMRGQIEEITATIDANLATRRKLKKGDDDPVDASEFERAQMKLAGLTAQVEQIKQNLDTAERIRAKFKDKVVVWTFNMITYTYAERQAARDGATVYQYDGSPVMKQDDYRLNLLFTAMESWSLPQDITREEIAALPPAVVETLANRLITKTEPSEKRLDFLA